MRKLNTKKCKDCSEVKSLELFSTRKRENGLIYFNTCKQCRSQQAEKRAQVSIELVKFVRLLEKLHP